MNELFRKWSSTFFTCLIIIVNKICFWLKKTIVAKTHRHPCMHPMDSLSYFCPFFGNKTLTLSLLFDFSSRRNCLWQSVFYWVKAGWSYYFNTVNKVRIIMQKVDSRSEQKGHALQWTCSARTWKCLSNYTEKKSFHSVLWWHNCFM